jgi:hypothetical protein
MIWNNAEFYTSVLMVELEKNVKFQDSPIALYGLLTSFQSPAFRDSTVRDFLESFSSVQNNIGIEIDRVEEVITKLPAIFVFPNKKLSHSQVLEVVNQHLETPYEPVNKDFRALGFFPSREGCPVREVSAEGIVYNNKEVYGKEGTGEIPEWGIPLVEEASKFCDAKYNHYKVTDKPPTQKVYIHANNLF